MARVTPRMRVEIDLPSGVRATLLVTKRCAVIEANGIVTYAPYDPLTLRVDVALELAELFAELRVEPDDRARLDGLG